MDRAPRETASGRDHGTILTEGTSRSCGKVLLYCGASNAISFGLLVLPLSDALVTLGTMAVIGILLSMGVSIFLLPGWRHR